MIDLICRKLEDAGIPFAADAAGVVVRGDCLRVAGALAGIRLDAIIQDPPWMTPAAAVVADQKGGSKGRLWGDMLILRDAMDAYFRAVRPFIRPGGAMCIFCGDISGAVMAESLYGLFNRIQLLTWKKTGAPGRVAPPMICKSEFVWYCADGMGWPSGGGALKSPTGMKCIEPVLCFEAVKPSHRIHPSQKPEALLELLIKICVPPGGIVADFFAGSFALQRAALNTGRKYLCVEADGDFCARAKKHLSRMGIRERLL